MVFNPTLTKRGFVLVLRNGTVHCGRRPHELVRESAERYRISSLRARPLGGEERGRTRREVGERSENGGRPDARRSSRGPFPPSRNASARQAGPRDRLRRPSRRRKLSERREPCEGGDPATAGEPGERPERRGPEAERSTLRDRQRREVSNINFIDTDGLLLVILSSGVQEGRPTHACTPRHGCRSAATFRWRNSTESLGSSCQTDMHHDLARHLEHF